MTFMGTINDAMPLQERRGERTVGELSDMMAGKQVEPVELFAPATMRVPIVNL